MAELTGEVTAAGRAIWNDGKEDYSEKTVTVPWGNRWAVIPSVDEDGNTMSEEEALDSQGRAAYPHDPITGEELPVFDNLNDADGYAGWRSKNLKNPEAFQNPEYTHVDDGRRHIPKDEGEVVHPFPAPPPPPLMNPLFGRVNDKDETTYSYEEDE